MEWREAVQNKPKVMKMQSPSQRTASRKVSNTCAEEIEETKTTSALLMFQEQLSIELAAIGVPG